MEKVRLLCITTDHQQTLLPKLLPRKKDIGILKTLSTLDWPKINVIRWPTFHIIKLPLDALFITSQSQHLYSERLYVSNNIKILSLSCSFVTYCIVFLNHIILIWPQKHVLLWLWEWGSACYLMTSDNFFSYIMAWTNYISMRWWCPLNTRPTCLVWFI